MELRHLEQIVAIARCGGFSGAARQLNLSQSTLSKSISRLESQLSVSLFQRDSGGARPTAYGQFLANRGVTVLGQVHELGRDLDRLIHGEPGRLRIGVGPAPAVRLLREVLAGMSERFPKLSIKTTQDKAQRLVDDLVHGMYDAVYVYFEAARPFDDLVRVKVLESDYVAIAASDHPIRCTEPLQPADLLGHRIAAQYIGPAFAEWIGPVTAQESEHLNGFRSDSYELILDRILSGGYVGVAPRFVFQREVAEGRLAELPLAWNGIYECWMLSTRERWRSPELKAMADISRLCGRGLSVKDSSDAPASRVA